MSENPERRQDAASPIPSSADQPENLPSGPTQRLSEDLEVPASTPTLELGAVEADGAAAESATTPASPVDPQETPAGPQATVDSPSGGAEAPRARHRATFQGSDQEDLTSVHRRSLFSQAGDPARTDGSSSSGPAAHPGGNDPAQTTPDTVPATSAQREEDGPLTPMWHARTTATSSGPGGQADRSAPRDGTDGPGGLVSPAASTCGARPAGPPPFPQEPALTTPVLPASQETSPTWAGTPTPPQGQATGFVSRTPTTPGTQTDSDAATLLALKDAQSQQSEDVLLAGSVVVGKPASRVAAHWLGVLASLVLLPAAWFLLHDGTTHLRADLSPYELGTSARGLATLGAGCLVMVVALWTARRSSLGTFVVGIPTALAGLPGLLLPGLIGDQLTPFLTRLADQSTLGQTLADALWNDLTSGRLLIAGVGLIMVGIVSHSTRRAGRREQLVIDRGRSS